MKNKKIKISVLCLVLFLISFFVLQYINKPFTEYKTEFAENYTVSDEIQIKGVSIKDETIISKTQNGQICYIINDGSKVAKDQLIGYQYPDATQAIAKYKSIKKEDYIKTLENAKNKSTYANSNYEILSKQIN
ncbi:MAG: HlyD family efflux transporter periplasmic adaptor subunit, partial [Oscillospiraceae bacterium]